MKKSKERNFHTSSNSGLRKAGGVQSKKFNRISSFSSLFIPKIDTNTILNKLEESEGKIKTKAANFDLFINHNEIKTPKKYKAIDNFISSNYSIISNENIGHKSEDSLFDFIKQFFNEKEENKIKIDRISFSEREDAEKLGQKLRKDFYRRTKNPPKDCTSKQ